MKNITTEIRIDIFIAKEYFFFLREMVFGIGSPIPLFFAVGIICYDKGQYFFCQTVWYLADIAESFGKQQLFTRQSPQLLKALREHALIESAVSSNRIEGVEVENARVKPVILGKAHPRDRNEEEVRAYREALKLIHAKGTALPVSQDTVLKLHRISRGKIWDAGKYKDKDGNIIELLPDERVRARFKTAKAEKTSEFMDKLVKDWERCLL